MVDLPPPIEELNEYGKYVFLNEMQAIATQVIKRTPIQSPLSKQMQLGADAIEAEVENMEKLFNTSYALPDDINIRQLIVRCAELYLSSKKWLELSNAYIYFSENNIENVEEIETCFFRSGMMDRYCISSSMIELTLTRFNMFNYFIEQQELNFKGTDPSEHDINSLYAIDVPEANDFLLFQSSEIPKSLKSYDNMLLSDKEYLSLREDLVWSVLRRFIPMGNVCNIVYSILLIILSAIGLNLRRNKFGHSGVALFTVGLINSAIEICTLRICLIEFCKPTKPISCVYPGLDTYIVQWFVNIISSIIVIIMIIIDTKTRSNTMYKVIVAFGFHYVVSVFLPLLTQFLFFTRHQRYGKKFKWIRLNFFKKSWWRIFEFSFIIFPPSFPGTESLLISGLRNRSQKAYDEKLDLLTV